MRRRVLGADADVTLATEIALADCLSKQGKHAAATELLQRVEEQHAKGPGHTDTVDTESWLAEEQASASE